MAIRYEALANGKIRDNKLGIIYTPEEICKLLYDKDLVIGRMEKEDNRRFKKIDTIYGRKDNIYDNGRPMEYPNTVIDKLNNQDEMITRMTEAFMKAMQSNIQGEKLLKEDLLKTLFYLKKKYYWFGCCMSRAEGDRHREVHKFIKRLCDALDLDYERLELDERALEELGRQRI